MNPGAIESAIIKRLDAAGKAGVLGYSFRTVDSLPVDFDEDTVAHYVKQMPAAWTVFTGWRRPQDAGRWESNVTMGINVIVGASNLRNQRAAREGVTGEVGSYQLLLDVVSLLHGQNFGLKMTPLELADCSPIEPKKVQAAFKCSLFVIGFTTQALVGAKSFQLIDTPEVGDFRHFAAAWDIPPHGETQMPREPLADVQGDALSFVTIPTIQETSA